MAMQPKVRILRTTPNGFGYVFVDSGVPVSAMPRSQTRVDVVAPGTRVAATPELPPMPYAPVRIAGAIGGNQLIAGAVLIPLTPDAREGLGIEQGVLVIDVLQGSPAYGAGLRAGDVIVKLNDKPVSNARELSKSIKGIKQGEMMRLLVRRGSGSVFLALPKP